MKEIEQLKAYIKSITRINPDFWNEIQKHLVIRDLEKEEKYSRIGQKVTSVGFLLSGIIRIYYLDDNGNEWNKAFLGPDSFLLSNIKFNEKTYVHFEALSHCKVLTIPISLFEKSLKSYPGIQQLFQHEIGLLVKRKSEREISLLQLSGKERYLKFKVDYSEIAELIPQYHIASYLGITPTQLSRIRFSLSDQQM